MEGTSSKPLLISDWSNAQFSYYCNACGIDFGDSANECFNHIPMLEETLSASAKGLVKAFSRSARTSCAL